MRKSERIRLLELQLVRLEMELELIQATLHNFLELQNLKAAELDAGKWYHRRPMNGHE